MLDSIKVYLIHFFKSRLFVLSAVMIALFGILIQQVFLLQIVNGEEYLNNYTLKIEKERELKSTRGNIYDRNGKLLAYNELAYTVTIEDNGNYDSTEEKNQTLNHILEQIIIKLDEYGNPIDNTFEISCALDGSYYFNVEGAALDRFLADVYGRRLVEDLAYNKKLGYHEGEATADQVMAYLQGETKFGIAGNYEGDMAYRITVIRYAMSENNYQKYISTTIASNVKEEVVVYVSEHADILQGVEVSEDTVREYVDSEYFAQIIGYTGKISQEEYDSLSEESDEYSLTDVVGKAGIEQYLDQQLRGKKGKEVVFVDNLGKVIETKERVEPAVGQNVWLSIDADLTKAAYQLLEQEIAGIVYDSIKNVKDYDSSSITTASDVIIPIDDVYFALIENNVLNMDHFSEEGASVTEQEVYGAFLSKQSAVLDAIQADLTNETATPFGELENENEDYISFIINMLKEQNILVTNRINKEDSVYVQWANGSIGLKDYLNYAIAMNWIDITGFTIDEKYSDSDEIYLALLDYIRESLKEDRDFSKLIYKYMIRQNLISGTQLCIILYDQEILKNKEPLAALTSGSISAYNFIKERIKNLEITPAQLALDPCSGSCVITDVKTGELLALVSYPSFDNRKLANTVDSDYFNSLREDLSYPMLNHATQERTAPGSTFKLVMATAGLAEQVIDTTTEILDEGRFTRLEEKGPTCWINPSSHGLIDLSEAVRDSCNYYFYETGYRLSLNNNIYNEKKGIAAVQKYAAMFGLNETTGIEIPENSPQVADEYPITASIGQSNNNYTTTQIARYVTAVANRGTVYQETLLKEIQDSDENVLQSFAPEVRNQIDVLNSAQWDAIHSGMRMVVENLDCFDNFPVQVAGKTGTAQQVVNRPNHALFVGFAPYENPQISIATRIAYGYTSHNAADVSKDILAYYFKVSDTKDLLTGQAKDVNGSSNTFTD